VEREGLAEREPESVQVVAFVVHDQYGKLGQSDFTHGHGPDGNTRIRTSAGEQADACPGALALLVT
jgi:hypothetical protein